MQGLNLKDFLKYDDVGVDGVDLAGGPVALGVVEVFVVGVLVVVELEMGQGAVAQIEGGDFEGGTEFFSAIALVVGLWVHGVPLFCAGCGALKYLSN